MSENSNENQSEVIESQDPQISQDSINLALVMWILTVFFGFIPGLIFYLVKENDQFIKSHSKEALNWSITAIFAYIVAMVLTVILIGALLLPVIWICNLIFSIMGAMAASKGQDFKVPFAIRLIK